MRFYKMTNVIKTVNIFLSLNNKQFVILENKPFVIGTLLLKHFKFDKNLMVFIKKLLVKIFNTNNNKFIELLYVNIVTFFDKIELFNLLGLTKDTNIFVEKFLIDKHELNKKTKVINKNLFKISRPNKKVKIYLYMYLCIVNCFFHYIRLPKVINILRKVLLYNSKEKITNTLEIVLEKLRKTYLIKLKINSYFLLLELISSFLMLRKILKSIYIVK